MGLDEIRQIVDSRRVKILNHSDLYEAMNSQANRAKKMAAIGFSDKERASTARAARERRDRINARRETEAAQIKAIDSQIAGLKNELRDLKISTMNPVEKLYATRAIQSRITRLEIQKI
jgi:hypothetical protein